MSSVNEQSYLVLARKYRPRTFAEVIGQEALVKTLANAIEAGRLHHAYVLTGIRGTGKTTTARLLAMALNCENGPAVSWNEDDAGCAAIATGRHVDVLEFDAASHTGVDNIRELFEGVAYAPVQGRYKVYIIDEVHMLSKQAFNALLKTLEEPPEHVKFIFATTEANKIPVTVLSRCQRFDLKRVPSQLLAEHFAAILEKEGIKAETTALEAVSRAAEGSVRDGLSLLDQAIALAGNQEISRALVEDMLGMADRTRVYDLFEKILTGEVAAALEVFDGLHAIGDDPVLVLNDLLDIAHTLTRLKVVPGLAEDRRLTEVERARGVPMAQEVRLESLSRVYQMLLTAADEARRSDRPAETAAMALVRVAHMAPVASVSELVAGGVGAPVKKKPAEPGLTAGATPVAETVGQKEQPSPKSDPSSQSWEELVAAVRAEKPALGAILEQQARVVSFAPGMVEFAMEEGLHTPEDVARDLRNVLKTIASTPWEVKVGQAANGGATLAQEKRETAEKQRQQAGEAPEVQQILQTFPGAEVVAVEDSDEPAPWEN